MTKTKQIMTPTDKILIAMLTENTGRAMCDSGGDPQYDQNGKYVGSTSGYGRNFERNQGRLFVDEPTTKLSIDQYGIDYTINLFGFLKGHLQYDAKRQAQFERFARKPEFVNEHWLTIMEAYPDYMRSRGKVVSGLYGDSNPFIENTYNHENMLSQDIQFLFMNIMDEDTVVILQIHGGADARGGYTHPRVFTLGDSDDATFLCAFSDGYISCEGICDCPKGQTTLFGVSSDPVTHQWQTDDGCHWYRDGSTRDTKLEDYEREELPDDKSAVEMLVEQPGTLFYRDGRGFCPLCGAELVSAGWA